MRRPSRGRGPTITTGTEGQREYSPSHGPGEGELLERLRAGDEEAFACLVDRYHAPMVRFARGYVRSPAVAERGSAEDLVPAARADLMDLYRSWRRDRPAS